MSTENPKIGDLAAMTTTRRRRQLSTVEGYEAWKASTEPPCTQCGGGKGLGHTNDCPALAGERDAQDEMYPGANQERERLHDRQSEFDVGSAASVTPVAEPPDDTSRVLASMRCVCGHLDTEHAAFTRNVRPGKTRTFCDRCDCRSWMDGVAARAPGLKDAARYVHPRSPLGRETMSGDPEVLGAADTGPAAPDAATPLTAAEEAALRRQLADGTYWVGPGRVERLLATLDVARDSRPVGEDDLTFRMNREALAAAVDRPFSGVVHRAVILDVRVARWLLASLVQAGPAAVRPATDARWKFDSRCEVTDETHEVGSACHPLTPHSHRDGRIKWARPFPGEQAYPGQHDDCIATVAHYHEHPYRLGDWGAAVRPVEREGDDG